MTATTVRPVPARMGPSLSARRLAWIALAAHIAAMTFSLAGILYVIPNLSKFVTSEQALRVYQWGMTYGGATHIILGAICVFLLGVAVVGLPRTLIFFVLSTVISASSELTGTGTGWPFGNYSYTDFLGYKLLGRVPFSIPLSWFSMGLASYLLAIVIVSRISGPLSPRVRDLAAVLLGTWFIVIWDLVLDPAMANHELPVRFWEWHVDGLYYGMPVQNYIGWAFTALVFIGLSRVAWRRPAAPAAIPVALPALFYAANIVFAAALSISVGLWVPVVLCCALIVVGCLPAIFGHRAASRA